MSLLVFLLHREWHLTKRKEKKNCPRSLTASGGTLVPPRPRLFSSFKMAARSSRSSDHKISQPNLPPFSINQNVQYSCSYVTCCLSVDLRVATLNAKNTLFGTIVSLLTYRSVWYLNRKAPDAWSTHAIMAGDASTLVMGTCFTVTVPRCSVANNVKDPEVYELVWTANDEINANCPINAPML